MSGPDVDGAAAGAPRARRARPATRPEVSDSAQRVLDAALALFAEHGFDGTSLQQIADRLGVTKAAVYYHFRTKNELLEALVRPAFDDLSTLLDAVAGLTRAGERRERGLAAYVDFLLRHRAVTSLLHSDITALSQPEVQAGRQELMDRVEALLVGDGSGGLDPAGRLWVAATLAGLSGALVSAPEADEDWLRAQLGELGRHLLAGSRRQRRRTPGQTGAPGAA